MTVPSGRLERLQLLDRYVRIRTLSRAVAPDHRAEVRGFWRSLGIDFAELWDDGEDGAPALFTALPGTRPGPTVLLYGHYDVQPPGDLAAWRWAGQPCDPWLPSYFFSSEPREPGGPIETSQPGQPGEPHAATGTTEAQEARGSREGVEATRLLALEALADLTPEELGRTLLVGRGGCDNKGQHLANILGVLELRAAGRLPGSVKILLDGEEEHGSPHLAAIVERHRDLLRADLLIGSDGPKSNDEPTIVLGVRGLLGVEVTADNGRGQSLHSGNYGNIAPSPVFPLARLLAGLPARVDAVARRHGSFRRSVMTAFAESPSRARWEPFLDPTTNVNGLISEGVTPGSNRTIIPGWARATVDVRLTPDTPPDEVWAALDAARLDETARSRGVTVSLRRASVTPSSYTPPDSPAYAAIVAATRAYWEREPVVLPLLGGTLPAFVFTDLLGMPAFWLPGAQSHNRQHDVNEHLLLEHFFRQSGWYAAVLEAVAASWRG